MKAFIITNKGLEDISAQEIKELISANSKIHEMCLTFPIKKFEDLFLIAYKSQSIRKLVLLLDEFEINKLEDAKSRIKKLNLKDWIGENVHQAKLDHISRKTEGFARDFAVRALINNTKLDRSNVEPKIGEYILDNIKAKVNLTNPETTFFAFINKNKCFFGVDFGTQDLGNRDYRIFSTHEVIKPNVAYALVRKAGYTKNKILVDPFCLSGTIPIEAALFAANLSQHHFDKEKFLFRKLKKFQDFDFKNFFEKIDKKANTNIKTSITAMDKLFQSINAAKKNAKIAGINKLISFSKMDITWMDTKFKKDSIDCIVSVPPQPNKLNQRTIKKLYNEFFHHTEFVLKEKGVIVFLVEKENTLIKEIAKENNFKITSESPVWQGKKEFVILEIKRNYLVS